jgi:two-component system, cell cycle response regulator DivK
MQAGALGARILIVDDEPDQIEMYRFALEHAGFIVDAAINGVAAIARVRDVPPDAIILDVRLPDMDGWAVCRALKADPRIAGIPVIILTAAASPTLKERAEEHGCAAYLLKPCYPEDLVQTVRQVLAAA